VTKTYYVRIRGRVQGPFDVDKVRALVRRGQVGRTHEVSEDGTSWMRAIDYAELFETPKPPTEVTPKEPDPKQPEYVLGPGPATINRPTAVDDSWYYAVGDQQQGPVSRSTLQQLLRSGQLSPDSEVWTSGMACWERAGNVQGLLPAMTSPGSKQTAPSALSKDNSFGTAKIAPLLKSMRGWTMFVSIVGLIACAIQLVRGIVVIAANRGTVGLIIVIVTIVPGTAYFLLMIFSLRVGKFLDDRNEQKLVAAMSALNTFWVYVGTLLCVALVLLLLVISLLMAGTDILGDVPAWMS
jgi:hypothetical protein